MKSMLVTITALLFMAATGYGESRSSRQSDESRPFAFTIASDKASYAAGDPITLTFKIMNKGEQELAYGLRPFYEDIDFPGCPNCPRVFLQNGENIVVKSKAKGALKGNRIFQTIPMGADQIGVDIKPGEAYSQTLTISRYFDFVPDVYEIYLENMMTEERARTGGFLWHGNLVTNTILIEVTEQKAPLQLTIASDKPVYAAGEPILVTVRIKNTSSYDWPYLIPDVSDDCSRFWKVETENGTLERIRPFASCTLRRTSYAKLAAGEEITHNVDMTMIWKWMPGKYSMTADYKGQNWYVNEDGSRVEMDGVFVGALTSNTVTIEVAEQKSRGVALHLQDGFTGQPVIVQVDQKTIYEGSPRTDPRAGPAEKINVVAKARFISLTIQVPSEGINSTTTIDLDQASGIGVSITGGKVSIIQRNGFAYD